jgi:hypothetical protein
MATIHPAYRYLNDEASLGGEHSHGTQLTRQEKKGCLEPTNVWTYQHALL